MYTIIEHEKFKQKAEQIWTTEIRWQANGKGKRGGVRIIYFNLLNDGLIVALDIYAKNEKENLSNQEIKQLKGQKNG